ncbi:unnamed protein product, partial [Brenthis ino]
MLLLVLVLLALILISCTKAQNQRIQRPFDNGHGWDIRLAVPGEPGSDYPVLNSIPRTSFTCSGKEPGYYADTETDCQVFRVCTLGTTYGFQSFLCPNGTLFNQAVFVCDWWMQVNCQKSKELINRNNDKFGNLKLGPQFMSDIKKMITHSMRNPYDKVYSKNNVVIMQEYKPPSGQLYSGNFYRNSQKSENSFYPNTPQHNQGNSFRDIFSNSDISFAASTPTTQFIQHHNTFNNQKQTFPYSQLNKAQTLPITKSALISNAHGGQSSQNNKQYTPFNRSPNLSPINSHLYNNRNSNTGKQTTYTIDYSKQQLNQHIKQEKQLYTPGPTQARFSKDIVSHVDKETKQNLVSNETQPRIITKTLAFRRIVKDPKSGTPRSRITFKTWIVRPSKSSKLITVTTPFPHNDNTNFTKTLNPGSTTNISFPLKPSLYSDSNNNGPDPYKYSPLRIYNRQISAIKEVPDNQVSSTSPFTSYKYSIPTKASPTYLIPTTFKPSPVEYIPPIDRARQISRQYLLPNDDYEQLVPVSSTPEPLFKAPLVETKFEPKLSINKQSRINTNNNNVTFSDILTKEKLDITVSDIVKDTNEILENDSPEITRQYQKNTQLLNYPVDNYLPPNPEPYQESDEKLILQPPPILPKSSRLIATLSPNLEPPFETYKINQTFNKVSHLPHLKEPSVLANTIERTVSLKITIPVNIAEYLFKKHGNNDLYNLEILNTPNNNYLVLTNNLTENSGSNFIPIGKLIQNNISNISDSQDLVFSLLADSINTAKEYNNVAQLSIAQPTPSQLQNDELGRISKDISKFTSSQHPRPRPSNLEIKAEQTIPKTQTGNTNYLSRFTQQQSEHLQSTPHNILPTQNNKSLLQPNEYKKNSISNLPANSNRIYSGQLYQLPVPDVTRQIYNSPNPSISNFILSNSFLPTYSPQPNSEAEVEIIPSQIIPTSSLQSAFNEKDVALDQGRSANVFIDDFQIPTNGISAQIRDNIVGTIPHPENSEKRIQYKKDQTYYFYSHLNNNKNDDSNSELDLSNKLFLLSNLSHPTFQLIPSVGYKLDNEKEKQNLLNVFQIDEYGNPKKNKQNENINFNRRQDISSDIDFTVMHPTSSTKSQKFSNFNALYNGPTSYSARQASVGSLEANQNIIKDSYLNSRLEKFDTFDKDYGYPKITPAKKFTF